MSDRLSAWKWLYRYRFHHVLMWLFYFVFFFVFYRSYYANDFALLIVISVYFFYNATAFYVIGYYLFPKFLYKERYGIFIFWCIALCLALSIGLTATLSFLFWDYIPKDIASIPTLFQLSFISIVPMAGFMGGGKLIIDKMKLNRIAREMDQQRMESELQYLKAQVNPHFLFNAINSVYFLIKKDPDLAAETLIKLSDLLRFQLYDCSDDKIPIEKELEYLTNFIALEKIRKGDKVLISFKLEGNLSGFQIAPFLLIPFLENAFKYVTLFNDRENHIDVVLERSADQFTAKFSNTVDSVVKNEVGGIGHRNVKRRLDLLYPEKHELSLTESNGRYTAILSIRIE